MNIHFRKATRADIPTIVYLIYDDPLSMSREQYADPPPEQYYRAFDEINADKNNLLIVAETNNKIVGTLQLTYIQHLVYQGGKRALIEGVRIDKSIRGKGFGKAMIKWAINLAKQAGCHIVELTTDKRRKDAQEFYKKLGFIASHEGMKFYI